MYKVITKTIECLYVPYFICFIILILVLLKHDKKKCVITCIIICFLLGWRSFLNITSSRYCCIFLLILLLFTLFVSKYGIKKIHYYLCIVLLGVNLVLNFSSFRDNYIYDTKETLAYFSKKDDSYFLLNGKDYRRMRSNLDSVVEYQSLGEFVQNNILCDHFYILDKTRELKMLSGDNTEFINHLKEIAVFLTNKKKSKLTLFNVLSYSSDQDSISQNEGNLIQNGDFEKTIDLIEKQKSVKSWLDQGADFYNSETVLLPEHQILLPRWAAYSEIKCPIVFLDDIDSINGKYSLHIKFQENNPFYEVYLLNPILLSNGILSFKIKNIGSKGILNVYNRIYTPKTLLDVINKYSIILTTNEVKNISILINVRDCHYEEMVFSLYSSDMDFLIDDVSFVPKD